MQWIKLETNFWQSKTAFILEKECGKNGLIIYLKLLTTIAQEIHTAKDVEFAQENGWTKPLAGWIHAAKTVAWCLSSWLDHAHHHGLVMVTKTDDGRINLKFKNFREFVQPKALSSQDRHLKNDHKTRLVGAPQVLKDKIREDNIIKSIPKAFGNESSHRISNYKISRAQEQKKELLEKHRANGPAPLGPAMADLEI